MTQPNFKKHIQSTPVFDAILKGVEKLGVPSYLIGGYVRDLFLERPSKDIDIVCIGSGADLANEIAKHLGEEVQVTVFKNFGTAMIKSKDWEIEFVGARKESYRRESRKPIVEDGTLEDDQDRRDFTINALAVSLNKHSLGEFVDPFGGIAHLEQKLLKTPLDPQVTFSDDPLRMMRAIRFASQLGFDIDGETFEAIIEHKNRIEIVSKERITDELNKVVLSKVPSYGFKLLFQTGLLELIFPVMMRLHGTETIKGKSHKDNFYHTLQVLDNISQNTDDLWLRWSAILHDIAKPNTKRFNPKVGFTFHGHEDKGARMVPGIFKSLKLPLNDKMKYVQKLVRLHLRPIALVKNEITDSAVRRLLFEAGDDVDDLMTLCRADVTSKNGARVKRYLSNFDEVDLKLKRVEEEDNVRNFQPVVTGELIMEKFDIAPGRLIGDIKSEIREAILDGEIKNSLEDAIPMLMELGKKHGLKPKS